MSSALAIRRWKNNVLLPGDAAAAELTRQRIDLLCRTTLTDTLRARLGALVGAADTSLWFVRRLELELACTMSHEDQQLADAWCELFLRTLRLAMSRGAAGDHDVAVRFESREEYLASFFSDLVSGTARGLWYYAEFESLFALPDGMVVVETLRKFPQLADAVLTRLVRMDRWDAILPKLSATQCGRLLSILQPGAEAGPVFIERLLEAWQACGRPVSSTPPNILRLYVMARSNLAGAAASLIAVVPTMLQFIAARNRPESNSRASHSPEFLRLVELLGAVQTRQLVAALAELTEPADAPSDASPEPASPTPGSTHMSSLAGLFFVWSALVASELSSSLSSSKQLRFLLAMRLAGRARQRAAALDPVPLMMADLEEAPTTELLESFQLPAGQSRQLQTLLLRTQFRRRWLSGQLYLHALRLPQCERQIWLVRDLQTGTWVFAADGVRPAEQVLIELRTLWPDESPLLVLVDESDTLESIADNVPGVSVRFAEQLPDDERVMVQQRIAKLRPLPPDIEFLSTNLRLDLQLELLLLLLGRFALQAFASRLPGFAHSSPGWLSQNFLETPGVVARHEDGAIDVSVVPPPLHVVLRLGGWDTDAFRLHCGRHARLRLQHHSERPLS